MATALPGPQIRIRFPGGRRVSADLADHAVHTDQPHDDGGDNSAPSPFDLFFASLATCAGYYVMRFCHSRDIPLRGVQLLQTFERDPVTRRIHTIRQQITVPPDFPAKYHAAVTHAASACTVKKLLEAPPAFDVSVRVGDADR